MKKLVLFLFLGFMGAVSYFGGKPSGFAFFSEEKAVVKKISAVKPKNFYSDRKTIRRASFHENENFSFFKVLNDPSLSAMMGLNGEVLTSHSSRPVKTFVKNTSFREPASSIRVDRNDSYKAAAAIIPFKSKKTISHRKRRPVDLSRAGRRIDRGSPAVLPFVVQVSSFRRRERAEVLRGLLASKGYASFIGKTELPGNRGIWHRVYIGRYGDRAGAERDAAKFLKKEKRQAMVVRRSG